MGEIAPPRRLAVEDDRDKFDCGRDSLNNWFRRHAWHNQQSDVSRTSVLADSSGGSIAGFVSLSATQIQRGWLPKAAARNKPDPLPAILVGQFAVDLRYQGQGCATSLMRFALSTALRIADEVGCFAVVVHPLDEQACRFYRQFGFKDLPFDLAGSMAVRISLLRKNGFAH